MEETMKAALDLVDRSPCALVGSLGPDGHPNIKAMFRLQHDGLRSFYFSTNTSSQRVAQFRRDKRACVYFADFPQCYGLMLTGDMEVLEDDATKARFWSEGCERYYPLGVTDPDYCILRFTARQGNLYHALENVTFSIG